MPRSNAKPTADPYKITEALLQERVLKRCRELGLFTQHIPKVSTPARGRAGVVWRTTYHPLCDGKGWLDTVILGTEPLIVELKVGSNRLEPEQKEWMARWAFAGVRAVVRTDADWNSGLIESELCALAGGVEIGRCKDGGPSWVYSPDAFGGGMRPAGSAS